MKGRVLTSLFFILFLNGLALAQYPPLDDAFPPGRIWSMGRFCCGG